MSPKSQDVMFALSNEVATLTQKVSDTDKNSEHRHNTLKQLIDTLFEKIEEKDQRIQNLELWKARILGALTVMGFLVGIGMLEPFLKFFVGR